MGASDPRRFCLKCSEGKKKFVVRVCPALEKERAQELLKQEARVQKKKDQEKKKRDQLWTVGGHNLWPEYERVSKHLDFWQKIDTIRRSAKKEYSTGGQSKLTGERIITFGSEAADAMYMILWHICWGRHFRMAEVLEEVYNVTLPSGLASWRFRLRFREALGKIFPPPSPSFQGMDKERLLRLSQLGDEEAQKALDRANLRDNQ
jgi:hypothetical protein